MARPAGRRQLCTRAWSQPPLPILLFYGTADDLVPISTSDALARELRGWVTYYRVPEAGHFESWNVDPGVYERRVLAFLAGSWG